MLTKPNKVKEYALEVAREKYKSIPQYIPSRVSKDFIIKVEEATRIYILSLIANRPSKGKTL